MSGRILILTSAGDLHSYAVAEAIRRKGETPILWHTTDFPSRSGEALLFEGDRPSLYVEGLERCIFLLNLKRLGLVFGCIDLIVTPEGDHIFLEVNEMGQFLFLEQKTGLPLVDTMAEFLLHGGTDFDRSRRPCVRYADVAQAAEEQAEEALRQHVPSPSHNHQEGPGSGSG